MIPSVKFRWRLHKSAQAFAEDARGLAAVEFALIVPLMLVMLFGVIDATSYVGTGRKVTLVARTLSDLTSQSLTVSDTDLDSFFEASRSIMAPYPSAPVNATISEIYIDPDTLEAKVLWSKNTGSGAQVRTKGDTVTVPAGLQAEGAYLIWSEVNYLYQPIVGYDMTAVTLKDETYTRPRQSLCVLYNPESPNDPCPTSSE